MRMRTWTSQQSLYAMKRVECEFWVVPKWWADWRVGGKVSHPLQAFFEFPSSCQCGYWMWQCGRYGRHIDSRCFQTCLQNLWAHNRGLHVLQLLIRNNMMEVAEQERWHWEMVSELDKIDDHSKIQTLSELDDIDLYKPGKPAPTECKRIVGNKNNAWIS